MKLNKSLWPAFEHWLLFEEKFSDKPASRDANRSRFNRVVNNFEDKEFSRENLNSLIAELIEEGKAYSTINNIIKMCKSLERYLYGLRRLSKTVLQDYKYFREKRITEREILTAEEIRMLADYYYPYQKYRDFLNLRNKAIILLIGTTGCRINEALELKYADIFDSIGEYFVIFRNTKANNDRKVIISQEVYELLTEMPRRSEKVFNSARGTSLRSYDVGDDLKKRAKAVGITKHVYNHLFRYSFIMTMTKLNVPDSDIMMIVGHQKHETFMRYKSLDLSHQSNIIHLHPLLRENIDMQTMQKRITATVEQMIDKKIYSLKVKYEGTKMIVELDLLKV